MNMNTKTVISLLAVRLAILLLLGAPAEVQAQFKYSVNSDNTITITGYTGPPWAIAIPTNINGLTVTGIGQYAFDGNASLTSVTIPDGVTSIGNGAFYECASLTSVTIPCSVTNIGYEALYGCTSLTNATIPGSVTSITRAALEGCTSLTSVTIPDGVTNIGSSAFSYCTSLTGVFFIGNMPSADSSVFANDSSNPVIYYLPGTTGWSSPFAGRQALLWNPQIQAMGVNMNQFEFSITGTPYIPVVVEVCTNLANPVWNRLMNATLSDGFNYFLDSQWTNYPVRFYRISSP